MAAIYFDHRELNKSMQNWISYGFQQFLKNGEKLEISSNGETKDLEINEADIRETTKRLLKFLNCCEGFSSRSFLEDNVQVQHYLLRFRDISGE